MKRFHVHLAVDDIDANVRFYSTAFGAEPVVRKSDYAKWMLDDPRINFAISSRGTKAGVDHLGFQVDSDEELDMLHRQAAQAQIQTLDQPNAECCYAESNKYWTMDPQGIAWEIFHTLRDVPTYGADRREGGGTACCAPRPQRIDFVQRRRR